MEFSAEIISSFLEGEIIGDKNAIVNNIAKIEDAVKGDLSFLSNPKYEQYIYKCNASIVIVSKEFIPTQEISATLIKVDNPYTSFAKILELYIQSKPQKSGISQKASISDKASIGNNCYIGDFVVIEDGVKIGNNGKIYPNTYIGNNVTIGDNVTIYAGVKIYEECVIGNNIILHAGTVIGADGFGFAPNDDGSYNKIPQIGNVILEDNVEIGANSCVDRATMGSTIIKKGVKLDNLVQIGHNAIIGENTVGAAGLGVAGSTKIGRNCVFAGQVGIAGHLTVADRTTIGPQAGIPSSVRKEGSVIWGTPAFDATNFKKSSIVFKSLPTLDKKVSVLEKEIKQLKELLENK